MKRLDFYKDSTGWFIDLPDYPGEKWDLQMVAGADKMLDVLSKGSDLVTIVSVFVKYFTGEFDYILNEPAFRIKTHSDSKEDFKQDLLEMLKEARKMNDKEEIKRIEDSLELVNRK